MSSPLKFGDIVVNISDPLRENGEEGKIVDSGYYSPNADDYRHLIRWDNLSILMGVYAKDVRVVSQ